MKLSPEMTAKVLALAGQEAAPTVAKRSKYGNRKVTVDGHTFDSKREGDRYLVLKALQVAGAISGLRLQCPIRCEVNGVRVCDYVADFVYLRAGTEVVEDVKGYRTREYRLKKRLVLACTGIEIQEV